MSNQIQERRFGESSDDVSTESSVNMKAPGFEPITIGDALEITALTAGNKPIEQSDAAAIRAAEIRASGFTQIAGVAAAAQLAADMNSRTEDDEDKTKLGDILMVSRNIVGVCFKAYKSSFWIIIYEHLFVTCV